MCRSYSTVYYAQNNSSTYEIMLANETLTFVCLYLRLWSVGSGERPKMQGNSVGHRLFHAVTILEWKRGLNGWGLKVPSVACASNLIQVRYANGSCAPPSKPDFDCKMAAGWRGSIEKRLGFTFSIFSICDGAFKSWSTALEIKKLPVGWLKNTIHKRSLMGPILNLNLQKPLHLLYDISECNWFSYLDVIRIILILVEFKALSLC